MLFKKNGLNLFLRCYEKYPAILLLDNSLSARFSVFIGSSSEKNKETDNNFKNTAKINALSAFTGYSLGYYPNTRTNIQLSTSHVISQSKFDDDSRSMNFQSMLSADLYYYFSPNFRLAGYCGIMYSPTRSKGNEGFYSNRNNFSASFNIRWCLYSIDTKHQIC